MYKYVPEARSFAPETCFMIYTTLEFDTRIINPSCLFFDMIKCFTRVSKVLYLGNMRECD